MGAVYADTSAVARILLAEPDARAIATVLAEADQVVSSRLLAVELRRLARRRDLSAAAEQLLQSVALVPIDHEICRSADEIAPDSVATLDAIHLATAVRAQAVRPLSGVLTYDTRLADGARHHGLHVLQPA